jgi:hypothetical protein
MNVSRDKNGEYCLIRLTQGQVTAVDAADYEWLNQWKWYAHKDNSKRQQFRAVRKSPRGPDNKQRDILMSRVIMDATEDIEVDHRDHDPLNNRRYNLRKSTPTQNMQNRRKADGKSSRFKGVAWHTGKHQAWVARITVNKKQIHLGYFDNEEDAATAYRLAAILHHGEFACLDSNA